MSIEKLTPEQLSVLQAALTWENCCEVNYRDVIRAVTLEEVGEATERLKKCLNNANEARAQLGMEPLPDRFLKT